MKKYFFRFCESQLVLSVALGCWLFFINAVVWDLGAVAIILSGIFLILIEACAKYGEFRIAMNINETKARILERQIKDLEEENENV